MIDEIIEECSKILANRSVVSEWEVERVTRRAALRVFGINAIGKKLDKILNEAKSSLLDEPLSIKSLHFPEKFEMNGEAFYHLHTCKPTEDELRYAYKEMLKSRRYINALNTIKKIISEFFSDYKIKDGFLYEFEGKRYYTTSIFLIDDIGEDIEFHKKIAKLYSGEYAVVALTEKDVFPFLRFFKRHSEDVKRAGFYIWVADEERNYVDPFIGYPKDVRLWRRFKNPKAASVINSLWRVKVEEID